ncbi:hypothetical protein L3Y34_018969 [Caenorhabditis briggsae]|uniref:Uncharacterized protein n=1 Tax=Caenorhabditis briggsae TaxID=6238 RepID=A0AAE9DMZ6_CAEBR|nr:hypothetical protein L3Y34_018969 [Caenorhabditis briggsae]
MYKTLVSREIAIAHMHGKRKEGRAGINDGVDREFGIVKVEDFKKFQYLVSEFLRKNYQRYHLLPNRLVID